MTFALRQTRAKCDPSHVILVALSELKVTGKTNPLWLKQCYRCSTDSKPANSSPTIATEAFFIKNDSLNSEADFYHSEEVLKENILFLVLNEKYDEKFLSFELLRRRDRVFAEALLQCSCLDVHLALAKRKIQNVRRENSIDVEQFESVTNPEKGKVFEVSHFIDSKNVTRNLSIELNWVEQYVGTIQPDQEKMANKEESERQVEIDQTSSHYDYGWAREEGLDLLRILGSNFEEKINGGVAYCECNFEGTQNEEVAYAIAKFECQVAGWNVIADLVKKLVTPE
ncbi:uncharacterized protein LOC123469941 [Daphnia magna]|uniref:uncharacterized protein LOC123469941 n=1 Tax=Daphnia magna TaxID=35525 RepID=UPI001E1BC3C9|nr:uncharacterized protein LOC123469941 [Daphnia magna]